MLPPMVIWAASGAASIIRLKSPEIFKVTGISLPRCTGVAAWSFKPKSPLRRYWFLPLSERMML